MHLKSPTFPNPKPTAVNTLQSLRCSPKTHLVYCIPSRPAAQHKQKYHAYCMITGYYYSVPKTITLDPFPESPRIGAYDLLWIEETPQAHHVTDRPTTTPVF